MHGYTVSSTEKVFTKAELNQLYLHHACQYSPQTVCDIYLVFAATVRQDQKSEAQLVWTVSHFDSILLPRVSILAIQQVGKKK